MIVLCPQPRKSRLQLGFDHFLPVSPATCTTGLGKEVTTENGFQHFSLHRMMSLSEETTRLRDKDEEVCWAEKLLDSTSTLTLGHGD